MASKNNQKKGISWTLSSTITGAVLQTLQLAITVRYLSTENIGIIAIVNVLIAISNMLKDFGLSSFLIHKQSLNSNEQSALFWLTLSIGFFIALLLSLSAPLLSDFYHMPDLQPLLYLVSINLIIISCGSQWQALMLKRFRFIALAKMELIVKATGFFSVILYLESNLNFYSPIMAMLTANLVSLILLYFLNRVHFLPSFSWDNTITKQAFKYGVYQVGGQLLNQIRTNLDTLLIGKFLGANAVGLYSLAKELILRPARLIQPVVNRFSLPNFASIQNKPELQSTLYINTATILVCINGAVYTSMLLLAQPITYILFGKELSDNTYIYLQVLSLFGFIRCLGTPMGAIAQANGKTDIEFRWNVISTTLLSAFIFIAIQFGLFWTTIAMAASQLLMTHLSYFLLLKPLCKVALKSFLQLSLPISICMITQIILINAKPLNITAQIFITVILSVAYVLVSYKHYIQLLHIIKKTS